MKLPDADHLRVDQEKITDYLLCTAHPDGQAKAEFFMRFGFHVNEWAVFAEAMRKHGRGHPVVKKVASTHGTRYAVDGLVESPDGRNPLIRTVWIQEPGASPRLITAYPLEVPI